MSFNLFCFTLVAGGPAYLKLNKLIDVHLIPLFSMIGSIIIALTCIVFGYLSDFYGQRGRFIVAASILALCIFPLTFALYETGSLPLILLGHSLLGLLAGLDISTQHSFYQSLFPPQVRCSAISFFFSVGTVFLGACIPIWCVSISPPSILPVIYTAFTGYLVWQYNK